MIPTDSRAVVLRFGSIHREHGPGLLLALPQPFETVLSLPSADHQNEFPVRVLNESENSLKTNPRWNTAMFLSGDMSVVNLNARVFFQVADAKRYVLSAEHVAPALQRLFLASAVAVCASRDLDTILVARPELEAPDGDARARREHLRVDLVAEINRRLADLDQQQAGLGITVGRVDLLPAIPGDASEAFRSVLDALQASETRVAHARTNAEQVAQQTQISADHILAEAQSKAAEKVTLARSRTAAISALADTLSSGSSHMLIEQHYADRIGAVLAKAGLVQTVDGNHFHLILPGERK